MGAGAALAEPPRAESGPILLVVMDPLAKELACACVKGYGQRDYRKLAGCIEKAVKQRVSIEFSDDLAESLASLGPVRQVIVIGDRSLVARGVATAGLKCRPVCELTDLEGSTTLSGSFIARANDPAKELKDIAGRKILFGLAEADAKFEASLAALRAAGVEPPGKPERRGSYAEAALDMLDSESSPAPVAVIPGYALRLLEGCGSVKPGNLKVIGKTQPVPFITVFVAEAIPAPKQQEILQTLLDLKGDMKLLKAMESRDGFRSLDRADSKPATGAADERNGSPSPKEGPLKPAQGTSSKAPKLSAWPDWRGPGRDGHVGRLPARLPSAAKFVWKKAAMTGGLAGLSVSGQRLVVAERDFGETHDVYRCLNADNGELLWAVQFATAGKLDYGQSPRATPVLRAGRAYLLGALGGLRCVELATGKVVWERQLPREFHTPLPTWGMCSTPLVVDESLIVNPGSTNVSLAALDCATGRTRWTTPGYPAAYSAFICGEFGGRRQIVGYDQRSLGGWDPKTGRRLWELVPPKEGDFNVPTPVSVDKGVIVCTENNGTRLYHFDETGRIIPKPVAEFPALAPTTMSPVVTCGRLFGVHQGLRCLDVRQGLKPVWQVEDAALGDHATLIADDERVLVITLSGELILLDGRADTCGIISRLRIFDDDVEVYSHPALIGKRLYARGGSSIVCVDLGAN